MSECGLEDRQHDLCPGCAAVSDGGGRMGGCSSNGPGCDLGTPCVGQDECAHADFHMTSPAARHETPSPDLWQCSPCTPPDSTSHYGLCVGCYESLADHMLKLYSYPEFLFPVCARCYNLEYVDEFIPLEVSATDMVEQAAQVVRDAEEICSTWPVGVAYVGSSRRTLPETAPASAPPAASAPVPTPWLWPAGKHIALCRPPPTTSATCHCCGTTTGETTEARYCEVPECLHLSCCAAIQCYLTEQMRVEHGSWRAASVFYGRQENRAEFWGLCDRVIVCPCHDDGQTYFEENPETQP